MEFKDRLVAMLVRELSAEYVRLKDDDGISGFAVSRAFEGVSAYERQVKLDELLDRENFSREDRRRILLIAALTPVEYEAVGVPIRVFRVRDMANGSVEIQLQGGPVDVEYILKALKGQKGMSTTDPKPLKGTGVPSMSFRVKGSEVNSLTGEKAVRLLKKDRYIEVVSGAYQTD